MNDLGCGGRSSVLKEKEKNEGQEESHGEVWCFD